MPATRKLKDTKAGRSREQLIKSWELELRRRAGDEAELGRRLRRKSRRLV
jgi:hypothetical protein